MRVLVRIMAVLLAGWFFPQLSKAEDACGKPFNQWSESYSAKLLKKSAWSKEMVFARVHSQEEHLARENSYRAPGETADDGLTGRVPEHGMDRSPGVAGEKELYSTYTVRLFSALPVRQAFIRLFQIKNHYKDMPTPQKEYYGRLFQQTLDMDVSQVVIVTITAVLNDRELGMEVDRQLKQATAGTLSQAAYLLTDSIGRVPLKDYYPPSNDGAGAKLVFPRFVDGKPVVLPSDKDVGLEFFVPGTEHKIYVTWKIKDLMCKGKLLL